MLHVSRWTLGDRALSSRRAFPAASRPTANRVSAAKSRNGRILASSYVSNDTGIPWGRVERLSMINELDIALYKIHFCD